jgi:hypothetical protein
MSLLTQTIVWLNTGANALGSILLAPLAVLPGWLSATLVAVVSGLLLLLIFKYTSQQQTIKAVRRQIKAELLTLRLFKESTRVSLQAQGRIMSAAGHLALLAIVPILLMAVPVSLLLAQLALWYQSRPLHVGEKTVLTMKLNGDTGSSWPTIRFQPIESAALPQLSATTVGLVGTPWGQGPYLAAASVYPGRAQAVDVVVGPVRVFSKREVCWDLMACRKGTHHLVFEVDGERIEKEVAVGDGFQRVSVQRPNWYWSDVALHPWEAPFPPDSPVQSIEVNYPKRPSWTCGTDGWVIYWFIVSFVSAFCFRGLLNVNV